MEGGGLGLSGLLTMGPQSLIRGKSELIGSLRLCSGVAFEGESLLFPMQHGGFNVSASSKNSSLVAFKRGLVCSLVVGGC